MNFTSLSFRFLLTITEYLTLAHMYIIDIYQIQLMGERNKNLYYRHHFKGELQRENKLISYERVFKMLENDMYIAGIGQAVLELLSFKVRPGNHQRGISLLQKFSEIFGNMRLVSPKMTSHLTSHNFQILIIEIFSKPFKI